MQETKQRRSNQSRTEATRKLLLQTARQLFAEKGYAETSTPEIVKEAGVTRGALYHHFEDKAALFRAVVTQEFACVADEINDASGKSGTRAIDALIDGARGYLRAMRKPGRIRIMLLDGPAVLSRHELERIDAETSSFTLREGLRTAMQANEIKTLPLDALTLQLSAMFDRAALSIAEGADESEHLEVFRAIIHALARTK